MKHIKVTPYSVPPPGEIVLFFFTRTGKGSIPCLGFYSDGNLRNEDYFDDDHNDWWNECYNEVLDDYFLPRGWWEYPSEAENGIQVTHEVTHFIFIEKPE